MPILESNIKLLASERLTDESDGGGRMTGVEILDGVENNLFPDVSELDRTYGRISMMKVFPAAITDDTDPYFGVNIIVAEPPGDPNVSATIFTTDSWSDQRSAARDFVERYVIEGALSEMKLLGNHVAGQKMVLSYQRLAAALPEVGEVYVISEESGVTVVGSQFVRVTKVEQEEVEYVDASGTFRMRQIILSISDPLRRNYPGGEPNRFSSYQPATKIRRSSAVDAARYASILPLAEAVAIGGFELRVPELFRPLIPGATGESPVLDVQAGGTTAVTLSAGAREVSISEVAHTGITPITIQNRGFNYVFSATPLPAPGSLVMSYRSQGKWYTVRDEAGTGTLTGDGSGTVSYTTGSAMVTLLELPDADTALLWAWGTPAHYTLRAGATTDAAATLRLEYTLAHTPVVPGTHVASYPVAGVERSTTDAAGVITGNGVSGTINYATGEVRLEFSAPPDRAGLLANAYEWRDGADLMSGTTATVSGGQFTVPGTAPFRNGGTMVLGLAGGSSANAYITAGGAVKVRFGEGVPKYTWWEEQQVGTFDATTGIVTLSSAVSATHTDWWDAWTNTTVSLAVVSASAIAIERDTAGFNPNAVTGETVAVSTVGLQLDLTTTVADAVLPASVQFRVTGKTYIDRDGSLYTDVDPQTGAGTLAGTFDYTTGIATLTYWADNAAVARLIEACLTRYGQWVATEMMFRTPGAPLQAGGFYLSVTAVDGEQLTATTDFSGNITGESIVGTVEQTTGVVQLRFGDTVADASLTAGEKAEPWYDPADVDVNGNIWRPRRIIPPTARFNCVVVTYLPLSADILGLDPVRLPLDGRVPVVRPGDVVVVHHTAEIAVANPVAGAVVDCGRVRLSRVRVEDADGVRVPSDRYIADLDAGLVTWANPLVTTGYPTPWALFHTIEDMALVSDAEIGGRLQLTRALTHAYPATGAWVSTALILGDLRARAYSVFGQQTWSGAWSDTLIGSASAAQYNGVQYPIAVTNRGATHERWRITFTNTNTFTVTGESVGQVAVGEVTSVCAPINPATGVPYFSIDPLGWGLGWAAGNVLRFNTAGANHPVWVARTVLQGAGTGQRDQFRLQIRGDVNQA